MYQESKVGNKAYLFAVEVVRFARELRSQREFVISQQLLKSGTSICANIQEAQGAQSRKDFIAKIQISLKEAIETRFWINLLADSHMLGEERKLLFGAFCEEIIRMLTAILKKAKSNLKKESQQ